MISDQSFYGKTLTELIDSYNEECRLVDTERDDGYLVQATNALKEAREQLTREVLEWLTVDPGAYRGLMSALVKHRDAAKRAYEFDRKLNRHG